MVNQDVIMTRLSKLNEYLSFLQKVADYSETEYISDPFIYGASERFLHLAIECSIDIANHIISDMRYRKPESNRDIFEVLSENKIIDKRLTESLGNMASFRNILVHDYLRIDRKMVYKIITKELDDIRLFITEIVRQFY